MLADNVSEEKIVKKLEVIKHPMIDETLKDLGIIKDINIMGNKVEITLALPFPEVPIKERIISSIRKPLANIVDNVKVRIITMNDIERKKFFDMERKSWKGNSE